MEHKEIVDVLKSSITQGQGNYNQALRLAIEKLGKVKELEDRVYELYHHELYHHELENANVDVGEIEGIIRKKLIRYVTYIDSNGVVEWEDGTRVRYVGLPALSPDLAQEIANKLNNHA